MNTPTGESMYKVKWYNSLEEAEDDMNALYEHNYRVWDTCADGGDGGVWFVVTYHKQRER